MRLAHLSAALCLFAGAAGGGLAYLRHADHYRLAGSTAVQFDKAQAPLREARRTLAAEAAAKTPWPLWGLVPSHVRWAASSPLRPPFRVMWTYHARSLVEFPPVIGYGRLYVGNHAGKVTAIKAGNGQIAWTTDLGRCIASSPALHDGTVYVAYMGKAQCRHPYGNRGGIAAFSAKSGKLRWYFSTGLVESSPLIVGHTLYFAAYTDQSHSIAYALDLDHRHVIWRYPIPSKVTASAAYGNGRVYFASYANRVYCLEARSGELVWQSAAMTGLGLSGGFYATPALAYGRLYVPSLDGHVYAFGAANGQLLWAMPIGGRIYSAPAIWQGLVFVGSYDSERFYALDAATGIPRWQYAADGHILGSATVMDGLVYFSTSAHQTYAVGARSGQQLWSFPDGQYSPLVADSSRAYLTGEGRIYGLQPVKRKVPVNAVQARYAGRS